MEWRDKEGFKIIRTVQLSSLRRFLGIRRIERTPNAQAKEKVCEGVDERIDDWAVLKEH